MDHKGTKVLSTNRLILRPFTMEDAQAMFDNWASDPEVVKFLTWPSYNTVDTAVDILKLWTSRYTDPTFYQWAITLKENNVPIGSISVVDFCRDVPEMGYCIGKPWWGQGITAEALEATLEFLFREVGVEAVTAKHAADNPASGRVMEKCGMTLEGIETAAGKCNDGIKDLRRYRIQREVP